MCPSLLPTSTNRAVLQQTRRAAASRRRPFRHRTFLPNVCFARHTFSRTTNFNPGSSRYTRNSTSQLLACAASSERLAARRGNAGRAAVLGGTHSSLRPDADDEEYLLLGLLLDSCVVFFWNCDNSDRQQKHDGDRKPDTSHSSLSPSVSSADRRTHRGSTRTLDRLGQRGLTPGSVRVSGYGAVKLHISMAHGVGDAWLIHVTNGPTEATQSGSHSPATPFHAQPER